jgi:hypothetical protein
MLTQQAQRRRPKRSRPGRLTTAFGRESKEPLRYIDEKGRVMTEDSPGQLTSFRGGLFFGNVLLNAMLIAVLFVSLWLLLLLFALPPILTRAEDVSRQRSTQAG